MGIKDKSGAGAKASKHAQEQRRKQEESRKPAKRQAKSTHHDGKGVDHKRRGW